MKASFLLLVGLIFGIVIIGLATLQSGVLILAIPLGAYLFAAIYARPEALNLTVTRNISADYAAQETPVTVTVRVANHGAALDELAVQDILPGGVTKVGGRSTLVSFLTAQDSLNLEYTIQAQRGEYERYDLFARTNDSFGLFEVSLMFRTTPHLVVHPHYPKLDRIRIRPPQTHGFAGPIAARQAGSGIDFWDVREYQAGDPLRQINWKLSARSERELYTSVFEQERVADVGLILDARQRTNVVTPGGSLFEYSVRAAAALAENFLDDGNRVSLLVYGSGIARVFPGYGRIQQQRILKTLARTNPAANFALESLTHLPTRLFPAKSQLVLISALLPEDASTIVRMRSHGYAVMIISPDPISYEAVLYRDASSAAYRIASAERMLMLRQIRQSGAQIVDWNVEKPLENVVREALSGQALVTYQHRLGL